EPCRVAAAGERVEVGVGGGVVALARAARRTGQGREEDERPQVVPAGELVQVPHGLGLRVQYVVESVGGEGADDAVVQDARAMHDGGQRAAVEQGGQGGPVGGVAGGEFDLRAQFRQLRQELGGAGGVGAGAAGEA